MNDRAESGVGSVLMEYLPKLIRLAEKNMSTQLQARVGADDMANSIIKSVFREYAHGKLPLRIEDSDDFWRFLVAVSLNKIRKKARYHMAGKRTPVLEQRLSDLEFMIKEQGEPSDDDGIRVADVLKRLEAELDDDSRIVLAGRLEGLSNPKIAEQLNGGAGMSTKSVSRKWKEIEARLRIIIEELDLG
jgi:hypothetical protein